MEHDETTEVTFPISRFRSCLIVWKTLIMPTEAKLGLALGVVLTITLAIVFRPTEKASIVQPVASKGVLPVEGQSTSLRK